MGSYSTTFTGGPLYKGTRIEVSREARPPLCKGLSPSQTEAILTALFTVEDGPFPSEGYVGSSLKHIAYPIASLAPTGLKVIEGMSNTYLVVGSLTFYISMSFPSHCN